MPRVPVKAEEDPGRPAPNALQVNEIGGSTGLVLNARAREHHWAGVGPASIKSFSGPAVYHLERGPVVVGPESYLILNDGEPYRIDIDTPEELESFCVFFARGALERGRYGREHSIGAGLDRPDGQGPALELVSLPRPHDDVLTPTLTAFLRRYRKAGPDALLVAEGMSALVEAVLTVHQVAKRETAGISALRPATRDELYRRLLVAREYLAAHFREPLTLAAVSRVAALSENRLIQHYREAFGVTPYQDVRRRRIETAMTRLQEPDCPPLSVLALDLGFLHPGAFSTAFRHQVGASPTAYRKEARARLPILSRPS